MKISTYEDYVLATENEQDYILKYNDSFYKVSLEKMKGILPIEDVSLLREINDNKIYAVVCLVGICVSLIAYFYCNNYTLIDRGVGFSTVFLLVNIPIHEFGHIIALKIFYPEAKFKMGFKVVFIYPAFYVDTSYSYMLPKYKRMVVYLAGNFMNCMFLVVVLIAFPQYLKYCYLVVSNILINFITIVKSDGYYAMVTLFNKFNNFKSIRREYIEDFIRGIIMFLVLSLISYIF